MVHHEFLRTEGNYMLWGPKLTKVLHFTDDKETGQHATHQQKI
jgi:hypothetical protein